MPSEVAEIIDVMTRSGILMYRLMQTSVDAGKRLGRLIQSFHRRYGLNGQVRLQAMQRLAAQGVRLASGRLPAEKLEEMRTLAAGCGVPFAVTHMNDPRWVFLTFRQQDTAVLRSMLETLGAERLDGEEQLDVLHTALDLGPDTCPDGALNALLAPADAHQETQLMEVLHRNGVHAVSSHTDAQPAADADGSRESRELILYPEAEEEAVRHVLRGLPVEAEFIGTVAQPSGPERQTFADRRRRRAHAEPAAIEPVRTVPREAAPASLSTAIRDSPQLAAVKLPAGTAEAALTATLERSAVASIRLGEPDGPVLLAASRNAAAVLAALQQAGISVPVSPASPAQYAAAARSPEALAALNQEAAFPDPPDLAQLRALSTRGAAAAAQDPEFTDFIRLAAGNPDVTAKNLFAALGQEARGRLVSPNAFLEAGGTLPAGTRCIWTGEPRRDEDGSLVRIRDPASGRDTVQMDLQPLICLEGLPTNVGAPHRTSPAAIAAALGAPDAQGEALARLAAQHVLLQYRQVPSLAGPYADAEAALSACIVLEHFALPVPADMPLLACRRQLLGQLQGQRPSFASFDRARQQAQTAITELENRIQVWDRTAVMPAGPER